MTLSSLPKQPFTMLGRWAILSGQVAVAQVLVQGVNAVTGLLLVRHLPKDEYAWFTIAGSLLATLNLLGDGGVSTGLTSIGGQIHDQPGPFARLLHDGLSVSRRLCCVGFLLSAPLFYVLLEKINAPPLLTLAALGLASVSCWPAVSTVLLNIANRLHKRVQVVQATEMAGAVIRLGLTGALMLGGWLAMLPAMMAAVVTGWAQALMVRYKTRPFLLSRGGDASFVPQIHGFVRSLYANHVFFCLQAQIATWIIGWLAASGEVADLGALGRLAVIFTAVSSPFYYLAVPAIARIQDPALLKKRFFLVLAAGFALVAAVVGAAYLFPHPFLWVLGSQYSHLGTELPLALAVQGLTFQNTLSWNLLLTRGWVKKPWIVIPMTVCGYMAGAAFLDLSSVAGVLLFSIASIVPTLVYGLIAVARQLTPDFKGNPAS